MRLQDKCEVGQERHDSSRMMTIVGKALLTCHPIPLIGPNDTNVLFVFVRDI